MHRLACLASLLLLACPTPSHAQTPRAEGEFEFPEPEPSAETVADSLPRGLGLRFPPIPEEGWGLPDALKRVDASASHAVFVRLHTLNLGGDFDSNGAEEVVVFVEHGKQRRRLADHGLRLPEDATKEFDVRADSPYTEFPPVASSLDFSVLEEDVTEWETMTGASQELALDPAALSDEPQVVRVRLETIRGQSWGFLSASKEIKIKGAWLSVELVRVARRDSPDDEARDHLAGLLKDLPAELPRQAQGLTQLVARLLQVAEQATQLMRDSTHTWLRARLAEEIPHMRRVARYAQGAVGAQAEVRAALLGKDLAALRAAEPELEALRAGWRALAEMDPATLNLAQAQQAVAAFEETLGQHDDDPMAFELEGVLMGLGMTLEGLSEAPGSQALLEQALPALRARLSRLAGR